MLRVDIVLLASDNNYFIILLSDLADVGYGFKRLFRAINSTCKSVCTILFVFSVDTILQDEDGLRRIYRKVLDCGAHDSWILFYTLSTMVSNANDIDILLGGKVCKD